VYEKFFVPALFGQWVEQMLDAVNVVEGDRLLDIGTGTGVVALAALRRVSAGGSVVAVDPNDGMLAVAKRLTPGPPRPPMTAGSARGPVAEFAECGRAHWRASRIAKHDREKPLRRSSTQAISE
jgi:SAM-dependent methyltransferase